MLFYSLTCIMQNSFIFYTEYLFHRMVLKQYISLVILSSAISLNVVLFFFDQFQHLLGDDYC